VNLSSKSIFWQIRQSNRVENLSSNPILEKTFVAQRYSAEKFKYSVSFKHVAFTEGKTQICRD